MGFEMSECYTIAVMNTKGGVGKSTTVMALGEALSALHHKNVLVIDSDSQTSISIMLMHIQRWEEAEDANLTLTNLLTQLTLVNQTPDWREFIINNVSDVDEAEGVYLLPSNMELSLFERAVSEAHKHGQLRLVVRNLLAEIKQYFDYVLIDCPPGISILTETWMRECDYIVPPTKPDYLAVRGLGIMQRFKNANAPEDFATHLGVIVNQKDTSSPNDDLWHQGLLADERNRCFKTAIPRRAYIQNAADFKSVRRSFIAKYPGDAGEAIKTLTAELLNRIDVDKGRAPSVEMPEPRPNLMRPEPHAQQASQPVAAQHTAPLPAEQHPEAQQQAVQQRYAETIRTDPNPRQPAADAPQPAPEPLDLSVAVQVPES